MNYHIAQANIVRTLEPFDSPEMIGLTSRIGEMNKLAEQSKGFIWRFKETEIALSDLSIIAHYFPCEPSHLFFNMSVWESIEDLKNYAFKSMHSEMLRDRQNWIEQFDGAHSAMWWIPESCIPTIEDSMSRLRSLHQKGPTPLAFTFKNSFEKPRGDA